MDIPIMGFYFGCRGDDEDDDLTYKVHRLDVTRALLCSTPVIDQMSQESEKRKEFWL